MKRLLIVPGMLLMVSSAYAVDITALPDLGSPATVSDSVITYDQTAAEGSRITERKFSADASEFLNGEGAFVAVEANLTTAYAPDWVYINIDTGTNAGILAATSSAAGTMSRDDKIKLDGLSGTDIELAEIGTATYDDVQDLANNTQSSGKISGGSFTLTNGDGTLSVASGTGLIRTVNSDIAEVKNFDWAANAAVTLTDNSTNYIYVDSAGTIAATVTKTDVDNRTKILLGKVYREATVLHEVEAGMVITELAKRTITYLNGVNGEIVRSAGGGLVTTEVGLLGLSITAGTGFGGLTPLTWSAFDSTGADTFRLWYNDGAWQDSVVSVIESANYNDYGVGLDNYSNNHFGTLYTYMHFEGDVHVVYGIDSYATLSDAELAPTPANLPSIINDFSLYIGKIIIQQGATTEFVDVRYPWENSTTTGLTGDHGALSGLNDDDHPQYEDELDDSAGLLAALNDETGTGLSVFSTSPTFVTPVLGAATATSLTIPGTASGGQVAIFLEDTDNGANYVGIGSPAANANDLILLLPVSDPTTGQLLTCAAPTSVTFSDGVARDASVCSWTSAIGETNTLETTITGIADTEFFVGDGADSGVFVVMSGDATLANTGALTIGASVVENSMMADNAIDTAELADDAVTYVEATGSFKALTPVTGTAAGFAAGFTGANLYGGTYICNTAGTAQLPLMVAGMNFTIITLGAIAVVADTNILDGYLMDGTTGVEGANLTNLSTAGDIAVFQYYTVDDWLITTNGWTAE